MSDYLRSYMIYLVCNYFGMHNHLLKIKERKCFISCVCPRHQNFIVLCVGYVYDPAVTTTTFTQDHSWMINRHFCFLAAKSG